MIPKINAFLVIFKINKIAKIMEKFAVWGDQLKWSLT